MLFRSSLIVAFTVAVLAAACRRAKPEAEAAPPPPLSDSAKAALAWVEANASPFNAADSIASPNERTALTALAEGARVIGFSEMTTGTHEFPLIVRRSLFSLAETSNLRGLAIQAPMPEAMELDRYVRGGPGDALRLLRTLGSWRWETREMRALVAAIRAWNRGKSAEDQIGFYGFELPNSQHAVEVVTGLPESVTGAPLKAWIAKQYACVPVNEGANFGLEGRAADSTYWNACGPAVTVVVDSFAALRQRIPAGATSAPDVAFAERMARLVAHRVRVGLKHLPRQEQIAEHVLFLADLTGANGKLMMWGADVEVGRLILDKKVTQTGVALGEKLGAKYRPIAYMFGDGVVRTRPAQAQRSGGPAGLADVEVAQPLPDTFEDVFSRVARSGYWLDVRGLPDGIGGAWLRGPRPAHLITELYAPAAPELFETPVELPKYFDAVVFVRKTTASRG